MSEEMRLGEIRQEIDQLDEKIQQLINRRATLAQEVAETKLASADGAPVAFYRPEREAQVLAKVMARNQGPLGDEEMARLFREIMSACLALEEPMRIAFLGPEGTFTQAAALKQFGHSVDTLPMASIPAVFHDVESDQAHYGVVPVENSTEGVISHTLDQFINSPLRINGEVELRIHHYLMSQERSLGALKRVYSHQQSLAQCRNWLDEQLPGVDQVTVSSNAEAARIASKEAGAAAIAGEVASTIYQLKVLARNIEDEPDNTTRFLVVGKQSPAASGHDKTSLLVSTRNRPGALYELLSPFSENSVSMSRIESRPSRRGNWDYLFFVDIEGHAEDEHVSRALAQLESGATMFRVLGSYPKAIL
ncbi:MAG: prephenate dehydratase [Gammaproteobacteria bacterium]|jgi:chorismate mutase / prephenate dehydratase|nr:prephenate dehydratase [Gammaproteobacteria bacterium]